MLFTTFDFLWQLPLIFCIYYALTSRQRVQAIWPRIGNALLIVVSYALYLKWKPVYGLILLGVTAITYGGGILVERSKRKGLFTVALLLSLLPLLVFKYYNFLNDNLSALLAAAGLTPGLPGLNWAMPLGISFFTFQAVGYLADVYLGRIKAEHNWWDYMLFVCFFPQIVSGPISKASDLLPQIKASRSFSYPQAVQGLKWLLWGMFLKVVVADSIGMHIDIALNNYQLHPGTQLIGASVFYAFQIYADFAGYSFMAVGVGQLFGFELVNNFRRPYFSVSVTEFWHRWHISLSTWLKDYIYIPLGGSRCSKARNYLNIFITFLVSGIWHGANWTFVVWGVLHGLFQIVEKALGLNRRQSGGVEKWVRILITFVLVDAAWVFFRMPTLTDAIGVFGSMFSSYTSFGVSPFQLFLVLMVLGKDWADEHGVGSLRLFHHRYALVRWGWYVFLLAFICVSGVYGGTFIYSGF